MSGSAREVAAALAARDSFILTSHARPDGDAIGSSMALAYALDAIGKSVRVLLADPVPMPYLAFPGLDRIEFTGHAEGAADAAVLLECGELARPGIAGLDKYFIVNVDHHVGNEMYGQVNWFDTSACACGEMVAEIIDALGVSWSSDLAAHLYLAIVTDTGGLRYGPITARTFEICRRIAATGLEPAQLTRQIFDSFSIGRVKIMGALLNGMELLHHNRVAMLYFDDALLASCEATIDDTEGLVNLPLNAREVVAVALLKRQDTNTVRVSLRSKGDVDVRSVAARWQGGGHRNAAGCTITAPIEQIKRDLANAIGEQLRS